MTIALRNTRKELYVPGTMTSNNADWELGWFYLRNDGAGLPTEGPIRQPEKGGSEWAPIKILLEGD
jgi:hypothetical protein